MAPPARWPTMDSPVKPANDGKTGKACEVTYRAAAYPR